MMTGRMLPLEEWWAERGLHDGKGTPLSRENIVRIFRDKNGGAHYDANVADPLVAAALKGEITGFRYTNPAGEEVAVEHALEMTMRQIAEEVRQGTRFLRPRFDSTFKTI